MNTLRFLSVAIFVFLLPVAHASASDFAIVNINDWGTGHIAQWEKIIDADDLESSSLDKWQIEPNYSGAGGIVNAWMNGYSGSISKGPANGTGAYVITNETASYRPELVIGDILSFSVQVQGGGFDEANYSPRLNTLTVAEPVTNEPTVSESAVLVSVNDWYNPSWGGGFNATFNVYLMNRSRSS